MTTMTDTTTVSAVVPADDESFERELAEPHRTVLAYFWAEWCGPCRMLGPVLEQLAIDRAEALKVVKVNADESLRTAAAQQIMAVPTIKVFRGGELVHTIVGAKPRAALEFELARYLPA